MEERLPESVHVWSDHLAVEPRGADEMRQWMSRAGAPHHLAKCNRDVYEFAVDVLDLPDVADTLPGASLRRRPRYEAAERQLAFMMTDLDARLSRAETGRLIRMVLHAEQGAMFGVAVTPRNYVLGIVFGLAAAARGEPPRSLPGVPLVRAADRFISDLATALRDRLGLPTQNPGGWGTSGDDEDEQPDARPDERLIPPPEATVETPPRAAPEAAPAPEAEVAARAPAYLRVWARPGETPAAWLGDVLHPEELVYLAHGRDGQVVAEADVFEHEWVSAGRPPGEPPDAARALYRALAEDFEVEARQLGQVARQAVRGRMLRIVLDVEQGALYYYRLGPDEYVVGVTTNQKRVGEADARLGDLVVELLREDTRTE